MQTNNDQIEVATDLLASIKEFCNRLGNMSDDAFIKTKPDLLSLLESFSNWLQILSRTSEEAYQLQTKFNPMLLQTQDRKT